MFGADAAWAEAHRSPWEEHSTLQVCLSVRLPVPVSVSVSVPVSVPVSVSVSVSVSVCACRRPSCDSCAASVSQDTIIVFGGVRNSCGVQEPLNDVWTYDLKRFQWRCVSVCADDMHAPAGKVRLYRPPPMPF